MHVNNQIKNVDLSPLYKILTPGRSDKQDISIINGYNIDTCYSSQDVQKK